MCPDGLTVVGADVGGVAGAGGVGAGVAGVLMFAAVGGDVYGGDDVGDGGDTAQVNLQTIPQIICINKATYSSDPDQAYY